MCRCERPRALALARARCTTPSPSASQHPPPEPQTELSVWSAARLEKKRVMCEAVTSNVCIHSHIALKKMASQSQPNLQTRTKKQNNSQVTPHGDVCSTSELSRHTRSRSRDVLTNAVRMRETSSARAAPSCLPAGFSPACPGALPGLLRLERHWRESTGSG